MKKTLLLCGLGLTVATSMVAGTMAIYTHTDTFLNADGSEVSGTAKKFYINTTTTSDIENFKLAPGESVKWDFVVTNVPSDNPDYVSEVNTDLVVSLNSGEIKNWTDLKVALVKDNVETPLAVNGNQLTIQKDNEFIAGTPASKTYSLKFTWDDKGAGTKDDVADTNLAYGKEGADLPSITGIKVSVTGNQHKVE